MGAGCTAPDNGAVPRNLRAPRALAVLASALVAAAVLPSPRAGALATAPPPIPGTTDPTFAGGDVAVFHLGEERYADDIGSVHVLADGRLLIGSSSTADLWRSSVQLLDPQGGSDDAYPAETETVGGGYLSSGVAPAVAARPDGRATLLAPRVNGSEPTLLRLTPTGHLDRTHSADGHQALPTGFDGVGLDDLEALPDGRVLVPRATFVSEPIPGGGPLATVDRAIGVLTAVRPDGSLDPSFGSDGQARIDVTGRSSRVDQLLVADGRIYSTAVLSPADPEEGPEGPDTVLVSRFDLDGNVDPSFGQDGTLLLPELVDVGDLTLAGDHVVVVGDRVVGAGHERAATVVRLDHEGRPDAAHGGAGGTVLLPDGLASTRGTGIAASPEGAVVVTAVGVHDGPPSTDRPILAAFASDGALDPTAGGLRVLQVDGPAALERVAHTSEGFIAVGTTRGGLIQARGFAVRLTAGGAIDPGFGEGGIAPVGRRADQDEVLSQVIAEPDGRAVAIGATGRDGLVLRTQPNGARDLTFGEAGVVRISAGVLGEVTLTGAVRRPDGGYVVVGATGPRSARRVFLARLDEGGALDEGFANGPTSVPALPSTTPDDQAWQPRIAIDGHGALLVSSGDRIARFDAAGQRDPTFAGDGARELPDGWRAWDLVSTDRGFVVVGEATAEQTGHANLASLRGYSADGTPDDAFGGGGHVTFDPTPSSVIDAAAVHRAVVVDGALYASGRVGGDAVVVRIDELGVLDPSYGVGGVARGGSSGQFDAVDVFVTADGALVGLHQWNGGGLGRVDPGGMSDDRYYVDPLWQSTKRDDVATGDVTGRGLVGAVGRFDDGDPNRKDIGLRRVVGGRLDPKPTISIDDAEVVEGTAPGAGGTLRVPVRLTAPSQVPVTVLVGWTGDSADNKGDLGIDNPRSAWLSFPPGVTQLVVEQAVVADDRPETDERVRFWISNPNAAVLGDDTAFGTIVDDDAWSAAYPSAPRQVTAEPFDRAVGVRWQAPWSDGATPVRHYVILVTQGALTEVALLGPDEREASVPHLRNGHPATVQVVAWNEAGFGPIATTATVTPTANNPILPSLGVTDFLVTGGAGFVVVTWGPPEETRGNPVTGYSIVATDWRGTTIKGFRHVGSDVRSASLEGIGGDDLVYVFAETGSTFSFPESNGIASSDTRPAVAPDAPSYVAVGALPRSLQVLWGPAEEHGQPIVGYVVVANQGGALHWAYPGPHDRSALLAGLHPGVPAQVLVVAYTASGIGGIPEFSTATPLG